ncbi:hypothetical protein BCR35DRAFT_5454 [Leucosporidium creatinivorum]|uniref:Uncharacterized protein n=1 Tax=Leucosporidium creatinivorum TaxID=106004 RepID=A0A1Y2G3Y6_9BASI|nr:hypothetical protein BCR35DRAFT_5454 [Leucosporidium creatinivorum]
MSFPTLSRAVPGAHGARSLVFRSWLIPSTPADLEVLAVDLFRVSGDPIIAVSFAHIRRLALSCPSDIADLSTFLQSADFPCLEDLALAVSDMDRVIVEKQLDRLGEGILCHAAKVKRFSFAIVESQRPLSLPLNVWPSFTALENLVLDSKAPVDQILPSLPTRLSTFRLRALFEGDEAPSFKGLRDAMRSRHQALQSLSKLILPIYEPSEPARDEEDELLNLCRERGIWVDRREALGRGDYAAHLEDSLDF